MPTSDMKHIWVMMSAGLIGPYKDYIIAFATTPQDKKTAKPFQKMFKDAYAFMTLDSSQINKERNAAKGAALFALGGEQIGEAPQWLKDAAIGV